MVRGSAARLAAATAVGVVAGTALVLGGTAANAAAVSYTVKYICKIPVVGTQDVSTKLTLSVPAKASAGSTVKIGLAFQPTGLPATAITNVTVKSALTLSGAQKGTVTVTDHLASANSGSLKADLAGSLKLAKAGKVSITAGSSATFALTSSILGKTTLLCKSSGKLPVLGSITVANAGKASKSSAVADER